MDGDFCNDVGDLFISHKKVLANNEYINAEKEKIQEVKDNVQNRMKAIFDGDVIDYHERMKEGIDNTGVNISYERILGLYGLKIEDFQDKVSLDIGGGFSNLPFLLEDINTNTIIVDPIFGTIVRAHVQNNISRIKKMLIGGEQKSQIYRDKYFPIFRELLVALNKWGSFSNDEFNELDSNNGLQVGKNIVNINSSLGNNIEGVDDDSVDIIFINHMITKSTVEPREILKQADKLLKIGGKIYIIESGEVKPLGIKTYFNYDIVSKFENHKSIFIFTKKS